jgi:hypothetical protein
MDPIRHECLSTVRPFFDAPDVEVPIRWYRAAPGAIDVPLTCFGNPTLSDRKFHPAVGCTLKFRNSFVGNPGGYLGTGYCEAPGGMINGVSIDQPPIPCECPQEMIVPVHEVPVGAVNGTNRVFTLSQIPFSAASLLVFNGSEQVPGVNYSVSGQTITFSAASVPTVGASLDTYYWVLT